MSLATRCTHCGTIFKVVQDQLKVSEGWVRCGRCQQVFNALEGLFDLQRDPPPKRRESTAPTSPAAPTASEPVEQNLPATREDDALDSRWLSSSEVSSMSQRQKRETPAEDFADAQFAQDAAHDSAAFAPTVQEIHPMALEASKTHASAPPKVSKAKAKSSKASQSTDGASTRRAARRARPALIEDTPEFVRRAERLARWRHPAVRATLAVVAAALLALLSTQAALQFKDQIAARYPQTQAVLAQLCALSGCEIQPPMELDELVVDSVALIRAGELTGAGLNASSAEPNIGTSDGTAHGKQGYRLKVALRNRAAWAVAVPQIELSLTDPEGNLVTRRALALSEMGYSEESVPADSATPLQVALITQSRISGYTVEIFYP